MTSDVHYQGFAATPSDYDCENGQMAVAVNLIPEDGALRPITPPEVVIRGDGNGRNYCFVHGGNGFKNYIYRRVNSAGAVVYGYHEGSDNLLELEAGESHTDIQALGNILIISTSAHLHYLIFRSGAYTYLGTELPGVDMSFALDSDVVEYTRDSAISFSDTQTADEGLRLVYTGSLNVTLNVVAYYCIGESAITLQQMTAGREYKIEIEGSGFHQALLFGSTDGSEYVSLARGGVFKASANYSKFKVRAIWNSRTTGIEPSIATITIRQYEGFERMTSGKVIQYNSDNYNAVMAAINYYVAHNGVLSNRFIYPFFVRYALRLHDGSYARISDPILMIPNSGYAPFISFDTQGKNTRLNLYAFCASLQYRFNSAIDEKWRGVVSGVDIFVSEQVYAYNQGQGYDASKNLLLYASSDKEENGIVGTDCGYTAISGFSDIKTYRHGQYDLYSIAREKYGFGDLEKRSEWSIVKIAPIDDAMDKIGSAGTFYRIHSFRLDEVVVTDEYSNIELREGSLENITTKPSLSDDQLSNCSFLAARLTVYNQRLHLFDYTMRHAAPVSPAAHNGYIERIPTGALKDIYVWIRTAQGDRVVHASCDGKEYPANIPWFFYPHNGAYKAMFLYGKSGNYYRAAVVDLKEHNTLNGAYWLAKSLDKTFILNYETHEADVPQINDLSAYPSSVAQSSVASPLFFSSALVNTIGVSRIICMSSAAKALSQGQFGQFPLYAFTDEGVWALEVSATGTYSAKQPISRDVCINAEGVAQLDSAVLFPTARGVMLLSGSQTTCISDAVNSQYPFDALSMPGFNKLNDWQGGNCLPILPFRDFLGQCRMMYDYRHQRIIIYAPQKPYAYAYSLKTQQWGMMTSDIISHINSYPDALAVTSGNSLVNFSADVDNAEVKCLYLTRPLKISDASYSAIDNIIQRGDFVCGKVATVLYGSRDMVNWHLVWSSKDHRLRGFRGTPYKYFRIAGLATLRPGESISRATIQFETDIKTTNRIR